MPAPVTLACLTPAPASSSRQRPADFGVRDVDGLGVEGDRARAQAGDRDEGAGAVAVDLEEEVFAFLGGHWGAPRWE